jgi:DNA-binding SARP family transcriptional activator/tetratricopeptide (TPR) repeat protein
MEIRLLGAMEVVADGNSIDLGPPKQRILLAATAVDAGRPVPVDALIDRIWNAGPPAEARKVLHTYVARVRRILAQISAPDTTAPTLQRRVGGYQLTISTEAIDLHRFRQLVTRARGLPPGDPSRADAFSEAVSLWRGEALTGVGGEWAARVRAGLRQQRLDAVADWAESELARGRHAVVIDSLHELVAEYPLAESLAARLLEALHRAGRDAEALDIYGTVRRRIGEEIGAEPGPLLSNLYLTILRRRGDGRDDPRRSTAPAGPPVAVRPAQLPATIGGFAGRRDDLARLDAIADRAAASGEMAVVSVCGTAGVGKTTLAVHWAHRICDRFPDGQLYVNLHGFDPTGTPTSPADALHGFLDALGVPPERMPATVDAKAALYRTTLATKRVLVVLDNVLDADQIRPLLPGAPSCLVVVTSRDQLAGLIATEGAERVTLELLSPRGSRELLALRLGPERAMAEPAAMDRITDRCAGLPLALAIVAARAGTHPQRPLAALVEQLEPPHGRLDALNAGDPLSDVRQVFSWSYRSLSDEAARLFRLLALHPGPDVAPPAVASLAGVPLQQAHALLAELGRAHLLSEHRPDRFAFHDLLRLYAVELAHQHTLDEERRIALGRVMDHYLAAADAAADLLHPGRPAIIGAPVLDGVARIDLPSLDDAVAWFAAERHVLLAAVRACAAWDLHTHAWQLAWSLRDVLDRNRLWSEQVAIQHIGLDSAQRSGNRSAQAYTHRSLGRAYAELGQQDAAHKHYRHAYRLFSALGDHLGRAQIHMSLGMLAARSGDKRTSLDHHSQALALFERAGDRPGRGNALNNIAMNHLELGEHEQAYKHCVKALKLIREVGDRWGEASTLDSLGEIHLALGQPSIAVDRFEEAIALVRQVGDRFHEALVMSHLVRAHEARGDVATADDVLGLAIGILDELGHPDADRLRARRAAPSRHRPTAMKET